MLLIDLSHTSHTRALTGVQRVCRSLYGSLKTRRETLPITHDPFRQTWRPLDPWEKDVLENPGPITKRGARWPLSKKISGRAARMFGLQPPELPPATGLILPEIFSPAVAASLPSLMAKVQGPRVAIFHDAIALKLPEHTPAKTVARFPAYLQELLAFDGIAAVSADSRDSLIDYWRWLGITNAPTVTAIPLGLSETKRTTATETSSTPPTILSVGSIEGRKNHLALLDACEQLWAQGHRFRLRLIGLAHPQTGRAALDSIKSLQTSGRSLHYDGPIAEAGLAQAYAECAFTVYPSLMEGFGLPVLESLAQGKPCICSKQGALGESANGGGCLTIESPTSQSLAVAIGQLLASPELQTRLATEARNRTFRTWNNYADDLLTWMSDLPHRQN